MNERSIRFPLFDLGFQLLTCNLRLQKIPAGERGNGLAKPLPLTSPLSLNIISIIRHHK